MRLRTKQDFDNAATGLIQLGEVCTPLGNLVAHAGAAGVGLSLLSSPADEVSEDDTADGPVLFVVSVGDTPPSLWYQASALRAWANRAVVNAGNTPAHDVLRWCAGQAALTGCCVLIDGAGSHWRSWAELFSDADVPTHVSTLDWLLPNVAAVVRN